MSDDATLERLGTRTDATRTFVIEDMTVRSDGDGRTVEAYAAVFAPVRAEISDQDGHYFEELERSSFNKTIADNGTRFGVFYNHGRTIHGASAAEFSVPIGVPQEVRTDERGVFTATRYLDNPLADQILDGIKQGAINAQSFSGGFLRSTRTRAKAKGTLPTIVRHEIRMREYGPTPFPAYAEAEILGARSVATFLEVLATAEPEDVERLRNMLGLAHPLAGPGSSAGTPPGAATGTDEPDAATAAAHSLRHRHNQLRARARKIGVL